MKKSGCIYHDTYIRIFVSPLSYTADQRRKIQQYAEKMDDASLRADYENPQHLVKRIPPGILELAKKRSVKPFRP